MNFMDSDICIELLREDSKAEEWLADLSDPVAIVGYVALELIKGCQNSHDLRKVQKFLKKFPMVWGNEDDANRAVTEYAPLVLSHGLSGFDALIASVAFGASVTLYTFNVRHFHAVAGLHAVAPYVRHP